MKDGYKFSFTVFCIIGLALSGCGPAANDRPNPTWLDQRAQYYTVAPHARIYDFFLEDGTRCVYVTGVREAGLSCDFDANRRRAE